MPVRALRHLRKMRGGAQSHLIECDDGNFYVVKYAGNPQHRRILSNELISSVLLKYLQISSPETAIVDVGASFIEQFPECAMQLGTQAVMPEPGWHFGSKYPGDPARTTIYDFVPDQLLSQVHNLHEFISTLAFDKWMGNADSRQSIFFRAQINQWLPGAEANPRKMGFVAQMIDHGYVFNGPHWEFISSPVQGLYTRKIVYNSIRSFKDFQPGLDRIVHFPEHVLDQAFRQIPPAWLAGDEDRLEQLLEGLMKRRKRVPDLIAEARLAKVSPFLNWPD
jgi:hypothetical protein